jgi:prepilin-type N-terminal cleavage/methylation domain-containing protein
MFKVKGTNMFSNGKSTRQTGFSMIELLVVMAVLAIMVGISIPYLLNYRKLYRSDDQAIKMMDLMREAGQLALTRRRTMRLEIDLTDNALLIIDETTVSDPDVLVKMIPLDKPADVRVDVIPNGVAKPNPPNYTDAAYATDGVGHMRGAVTVTGHNVWAARFQRDGSVVTAADNPISVNIYIWPPASAGSLTPRNRKEIRAITMFGGSGAMRFWKHNGTTFVAT